MRTRGKDGVGRRRLRWAAGVVLFFALLLFCGLWSRAARYFSVGTVDVRHYTGTRGIVSFADAAVGVWHSLIAAQRASPDGAPNRCAALTRGTRYTRGTPLPTSLPTFATGLGTHAGRVVVVDTRRGTGKTPPFAAGVRRRRRRPPVDLWSTLSVSRPLRPPNSSPFRVAERGSGPRAERRLVALVRAAGTQPLRFMRAPTRSTATPTTHRAFLQTAPMRAPQANGGRQPAPLSLPRNVRRCSAQPFETATSLAPHSLSPLVATLQAHLITTRTSSLYIRPLSSSSSSSTDSFISLLCPSSSCTPISVS